MASAAPLRRRPVRVSNVQGRLIRRRVERPPTAVAEVEHSVITSACDAPPAPVAHTRKTFTFVQRSVQLGGVVTRVTSPLADPQLSRSAGNAPYTAGSVPSITKTLDHVAPWQTKYTHTAVRNAVPGDGKRTPPAQQDVSLTQRHKDVTQPFRNADYDPLARACKLAQIDESDMQVLRHMTPDQAWHALLSQEHLSEGQGGLKKALQFLATHGRNFDDVIALLPAEHWRAPQLEALRICLHASLIAEQLGETSADGQLAAQAARGAALVFSHRRQANATEADITAALRQQNLLTPFFNWKHGITNVADTQRARDELYEHVAHNFTRAYRLKTRWTTRFHPRRLIGRKRSTIWAMLNRLRGLRHDLPERGRKALDDALEQATTCLFQDPSNALLKTLMQHAPRESRLEIARRVAVLRYLHDRAALNRKPDIDLIVDRPFFTSLPFTPQDMARLTLREMNTLWPQLGEDDPSLTADLHNALKTIFVEPSKTRCQPPSTDELLKWHREWTTLLGQAKEAAANPPAPLAPETQAQLDALTDLLNGMQTQLQKATDILASEKTLKAMTPQAYLEAKADIYGHMHNHKATYYTGSQHGINARAMVYFAPAAGVRPKFRQIVAHENMLGMGQSLSGSYMMLGSQWRFEGEAGIDGVLGIDGVVNMGELLRANISAGVDAGYKYQHAGGLMLRANKMVDQDGKVIEWDANDDTPRTIARENNIAFTRDERGEPRRDEHGNLAPVAPQDSNRWTMIQMEKFIANHCKLERGQFSVPTNADALWDDLAEKFFTNPNLQISLYGESKNAQYAGINGAAALRVGAGPVGIQASANVRAEVHQEQRAVNESSKNHAAILGAAQTGWNVTADATLGIAMPRIKRPGGNVDKITVQAWQALQTQAVLLEQRKNVQLRLQFINDKLEPASFTNVAVRTLPQLRALLHQNADVWQDMAEPPNPDDGSRTNGAKRLQHFEDEYLRHYAHLPNTEFVVTTSILDSAANDYNDLGGHQAMLKHALAAANSTGDHDVYRHIAEEITQAKAMQRAILADPQSWVPYAIDAWQNSASATKVGINNGLVTQYTEGANRTLLLMRLTAKPEQRQKARRTFDRPNLEAQRSAKRQYLDRKQQSGLQQARRSAAHAELVMPNPSRLVNMA